MTIPKFVEGKVTPRQQNHEESTYSKRFDKIDSELKLDLENLPTGDIALQTLCKIKAYSGIGDTFFVDKDKRVKVKGAVLKNGALTLTRVIPEGKKEVDFNTYLASR
jgi:methionyl-tRNA formyltransferase